MAPVAMYLLTLLGDKPTKPAAVLIVSNSLTKLWDLSYIRVAAPLVLSLSLSIVYLLTRGLDLEIIRLP